MNDDVVSFAVIVAVEGETSLDSGGCINGADKEGFSVGTIAGRWNGKGHGLGPGFVLLLDRHGVFC